MEVVKKNYSLFELIGASYIELLKIRPLLEYDSIEEIYARLMCAYYQNDHQKISRIFNQLPPSIPNEFFEFLNDFIQFRRDMVLGTLNKEKVLKLATYEHAEWIGESSFCAALGAYKIKEFELAKELFLKSSSRLKSQGVLKKSLLAKLNAITMEGNINNKNKLICAYLSYIDECIDVGARDTTANAYLNIADEYYKMGAFNTAYTYCEKSLSELKGQSNTHQEGEALALKIEILCGLERKKEAKEMMEALSKNMATEFIQALRVIEFRHFSGSKDNIELDKLSPPWKVKLNNYFDIIKLGQLEDQLVFILGSGGKTLDQITQILYPGVDEGDSLNRLTTLLTRINKKCEKLIQSNPINSTYELSFNSPLEEIDI